MLRDQAPGDGGLLVEKIGGPSVKPYQPAGLWDVSRWASRSTTRPTATISTAAASTPSGSAPSRRRRWSTFDAADRSICTSRRQSTSTPLQALALLNDVQIVEAARPSASAC